MKFSFRLAVPGLLSVAFALASSGCASTCCTADCEKEAPVAVADLPAPVKATLDRETAGGKVTEAEKEIKKGKTVYSFDAEVGGKLWDIAIAEDGTLLSKEQEK